MGARLYAAMSLADGRRPLLDRSSAASSASAQFRTARSHRFTPPSTRTPALGRALGRTLSGLLSGERTIDVDVLALSREGEDKPSQSEAGAGLLATIRKQGFAERDPNAGRPRSSGTVRASIIVNQHVLATVRMTYLLRRRVVALRPPVQTLADNIAASVSVAAAIAATLGLMS